MGKLLFVIALIVCGFSLAAALLQHQYYTSNFLQSLPTKDVVITKSNTEAFTVHAWVATTTSQQEQGLMYVTSMANDHGMLFISPAEQVQYFWMKNTFIPLDMIFINKNHVIVSIVQNATPCKTQSCKIYTSVQPAMAVLEVNAGYSKEHAIQPGDSVAF